MLACSKVLTSTQLCALVRAAQLPHALLLSSSGEKVLHKPYLEACSCHGGSNTATFHTGATTADDDKQHPANSTEQQTRQHAASSTVTEEELSKLFDNELQQRLLSAAAAARQASLHSQETPSSTTSTSSSIQEQQQQQPDAVGRSLSSPSSTPGNTSTGATGSSSWTPQHAARAWQQSVAPTWNPLVSADPWAPLPTPAASRCGHKSLLLRACLSAGGEHLGVSSLGFACQCIGMLLGMAARQLAYNRPCCPKLWCLIHGQLMSDDTLGTTSQPTA